MANSNLVVSPPPSRGLFDGMSGVTIVSSDNNPKDRLGEPRCAGGGILRRPCDLKTYVVDVFSKNVPAAIVSNRSNSVDQGVESDSVAIAEDDIATKFLVDSSTITIPITSNSQPFSLPSVPKYKTMPSPTRSNTSEIISSNNCLNEIFEEGTDVGSSDSATTTPRPVARHTHYINNRAQSQSSASSTQRRSKFHKTRTASCSSSDASDDDSENRKKRAHKIVDSTKPVQPQRRDSHDDSSDSQDPGQASATGGNQNTADYPIIVGTHPPGDQQQTTNNGGQQTNGRQKSGQQMGFRRHRAGRRRAGETRLRESQSLNRITEVQESELPLSALVQTAQIQSMQSSNQTTISGNTTPTTATQSKPKGFSARLFHGFRKNDTASTTTPTVDQCPRIPQPGVTTEDDVDIVIGVELAKALKVNESKSSSATKKLKMLGRYFQVNLYNSIIIFFFFKIKLNACLISIFFFIFFFHSNRWYVPSKIESKTISN